MTDTVQIADVVAALEALRTRRPLVQNITNYVAMTISANVLLALGASPAMVHALEEVEDFVAISDVTGGEYRHALATVGRGDGARRAGGERLAQALGA